MKIEFTGRQTEITDDVRALAERKVEKLSRLLRGITRVHVVLTTEKRERVAEVTVHSRKVELVAHGRKADAGLSVADAMDKLLRRAQRALGKRREAKRGLVVPGA